LVIREHSLWIASVSGHSVWRLDLQTGLIHRVAGTGRQGDSGDGGDPLAATFDGPRGMTMSAAGILYVAEGENNKIREIDTVQGSIRTIAGVGHEKHHYAGDGILATTAPLWQPHGVCVSLTGDRDMLLVPELTALVVDPSAETGVCHDITHSQKTAKKDTDDSGEVFGNFPASWTAASATPGLYAPIVFRAGDANRDGHFDQRDVVQVLQFGKYQTGEPAAFRDGDWNGDGLFDRLDLVLALQTGNYLQWTYPAQALGGSVLAKQKALHPIPDSLDAFFADFEKL
jgi:hypothetical protein